MEDRLEEVDKTHHMGKIREMGKPHPMVHTDRVETSHGDVYDNYT
jgi:hypothetical protein